MEILFNMRYKWPICRKNAFNFDVSERAKANNNVLVFRQKLSTIQRTKKNESQKKNKRNKNGAKIFCYFPPSKAYLIASCNIVAFSVFRFSKENELMILRLWLVLLLLDWMEMTLDVGDDTRTYSHTFEQVNGYSIEQRLSPDENTCKS